MMFIAIKINKFSFDGIIDFLNKSCFIEHTQTHTRTLYLTIFFYFKFRV
jgi:hypothetical protein